MRVYEPTSATPARPIQSTSSGHQRRRPPSSSGIEKHSSTPSTMPSSSGPVKPPVARSNWNCPRLEDESPAIVCSIASPITPSAEIRMAPTTSSMSRRERQSTYTRP